MAFGKAFVDIGANLKPLKQGLLNAKAIVKKGIGTISSGLKGAFGLIQSGLTKIIRLAKLAAIALAGIGIATVKLSSDVEETENLFVESVGDMIDVAREWATEYSVALGLFESDTKKALGTFFLMINLLLPLTFYQTTILWKENLERSDVLLSAEQYSRSVRKPMLIIGRPFSNQKVV